MQEKPQFWVRDIPIYGDVILAPMAGFSDVPCRAISRAHGSAMNYTEFVAAEALLGEPNPQWRRLDYQEGEYPVVFQIFGNDANRLLDAAQRIESQLNPHIIDINMGCSVRSVSGRGAGAGMTPKLIEETFRLLTRHLTVPVTGKIRLGWDDDNKNYVEIARIMEDNGASLVAMHGRTKQQRYDFSADWDAIAILKQSVTIPVIGNGDVKTAEDIDAMKAHTDCDAVMIGRAAVGNPWIFDRRNRTEIPFDEVAQAIRLHLDEMVNYYGEKGLKLFGRHVRRYFYGLPRPMMRTLIEQKTLADFDAKLSEIEEALPVDTHQHAF